MPETTMNKQLTGAEIIEAMLDKLRTKFRTDCYLNPNSAYDWFTARISIELDMHDTGTMIQVNHAVEIGDGVKPAGDTEHVEGVLEIEAAPPNQVRRETGQDIPTLTKDPKTGKLVEKGVRYSRKTGSGAAMVLFLLISAGIARGQANPAPAPTPTPSTTALTVTERLALQGVYERNARVDAERKVIFDDLRALEDEIAKTHPGYHFNEANGQLVRDGAAKK